MLSSMCSIACLPWAAGALVQGERAVSSALAGAQLPPPLADLLGARASPQAGAPAGGPAAPARSSAPVPMPQHYRALAFVAHRGGAVATAGAPRPPITGGAGGGGGGDGGVGSGRGSAGTSRLEFDGASGSVMVPGGARGSGSAAGALLAAEGAGSPAAGPAAEPAAERRSLPESPLTAAAAVAAAAGAADALSRGAQGLQAAAGRAVDPNPSLSHTPLHGPDLSAALSPADAADSALEARQPGGSSAVDKEAKFGVASAFAARTVGPAGGAGAAAANAGGGAGQMSAPLASPAQQLKQVPPFAVGGDGSSMSNIWVGCACSQAISGKQLPK